jgi:hypothetical protein
MHVHVAHRDGLDAQRACQSLQLNQPLSVIRPAMQFDAQPQRTLKPAAQPGALFLITLIKARQPDCQQPVQRIEKIIMQQTVLAFFCSPPGQRDQPAQRLIPGQRFDQQHHFWTLLDAHFAADDQRQPGLERGLPGADDPGQGAFVGDRQSRVAVKLCALEQFQRAGCPALKAEVGQAVQLCVFSAHENQPCNTSAPSSPTCR